MSVTNPMISVVVPVYNVETYLRECLDSVLAQTYTDYEVVMVDDGSADSSGAICDEYAGKDGRFHVIHRENGGLSIARNTGLDASKGEYIYFLDSDDWIDKETLEKLLNKMEATGADFIFFDGRSFEDSEKGYHIKQGYTRKKEYAVAEGIRVFDALQDGGDYKSAVPTYFWKKSFLQKSGLRFYPGILYEDMIFSFAAFCYAKTAAHCCQALYHRRVRPDSIVTSKPNEKNFDSACIAYQEIVRIAAENDYMNRSSVVRYIVRCAMRPMDIYSRLLRTDKQKCQGKYQYFIQTIRAAKGYGDKALYYRTYGKCPWAIIKAFEKITRR